MNARLLTWPQRVTRLWCRTCQGYQPWREGFLCVQCVRCRRVLINEPADGVWPEEGEADARSL